MIPQNKFNIHTTSYDGKYEEVKEKVLENNRLVFKKDEVRTTTVFNILYVC